MCAHKGVELYGKTLGIIGAGKIGFGVARRQKFRMKIVAFDPYLSDEKARDVKLQKWKLMKPLRLQISLLSIPFNSAD